MSKLFVLLTFLMTTGMLVAADADEFLKKQKIEYMNRIEKADRKVEKAKKEREEDVLEATKDFIKDLEKVKVYWTKKGKLKEALKYQGQIDELQKMVEDGRPDKNAESAALGMREEPLLIPKEPVKPPKGKYTSLAKLTPASAEVHAHGYKVNKYLDNQTPIIDDRECNEFLYAHPPSKVTFRLTGPAKHFTAVGYSFMRKEGIVFVVSLDGKELYRSKPLESCENGLARISVPLDLKWGKKGTLSLEMEAGDPVERHGAWCDPRVYR